jgi:hypothetical protein
VQLVPSLSAYAPPVMTSPAVRPRRVSPMRGPRRCSVLVVSGEAPVVRGPRRLFVLVCPREASVVVGQEEASLIRDPRRRSLVVLAGEAPAVGPALRGLTGVCLRRRPVVSAGGRPVLARPCRRSVAVTGARSRRSPRQRSRARPRQGLFQRGDEPRCRAHRPVERVDAHDLDERSGGDRHGSVAARLTHPAVVHQAPAQAERAMPCQRRGRGRSERDHGDQEADQCADPA